jgi:glucan phosphoethanolaminetransferase (alkaline phosphatase superfamily)
MIGTRSREGIMKRLVMALCLVVVGSGFAMAQRYNYGIGSNPSSNYVNAYMNQSGNQIPGHYQTNPNQTQYDNFNTRGNYNPYNGQTGTRNPRY